MKLGAKNQQLHSNSHTMSYLPDPLRGFWNMVETQTVGCSNSLVAPNMFPETESSGSFGWNTQLMRQ